MFLSVGFFVPENRNVMDENEKIFILSDESRINSKGYKVLLSGGRFERFDSNPVMLYNHDEDKVIGYWTNRAVEGIKMSAKPFFDLEDAFAAETARKVEKGFLKGASIGIMPLKMEVINDEYVMTEWEMVEASIVPIPSDAGAIVLYNDKKEKLSFEQVKLNFNLNNNQLTNEKMALELSQRTIESLSLGTAYTSKDVEIAVSEKDKEIETLKADLDKMKNDGIEDYLNNAVKAGKINEAEKLSYSKLAKKDFGEVKSIIDAKGEKASTSLKDMETKSTLSAGREAWDYMKWMKEDPKGLDKLKHENPAEFEKLQLTLKK